MRLKEIRYPDGLPVDGYGPGFFRIAGELCEGPVLIAAGALVPWAGLEDETPLTALAGRVDLVLVGTGDVIAPLPNRLQARLEADGLGVEIMASPSAARTYNVLLSEGRHVAVALLPVTRAGR
ncbi:uncharacterized protein Ga0609869_002680 [Rhodovulum iodosum]|uniref:Mth938-like domain-containing protein n=1 Tax=Rhodovulum iodosum TaxID=68291 RepID=A0ABV3XYA0_9RHOB|nr:Mth938-like domain-containing protein [Rhodovulum robiginosum]RSK33499.1 hypothetical protein EJA01_09385 [Rhodovulum robiginosum]